MGTNDDSVSPDDEPWLFYRDREEWSDISPLPQNDSKYDVVKIAYTEAFKDVYDYFRAVVAKGELSERALNLTEDAINMNAANYTVWQYRRKILKHLGYGLEAELAFSREMIELNPKNYQVWHHRRMVVEWLGDASRERHLTEIIFSHDAKNYHAWEHRQWVLRTFKNFEGELDYVNTLLEQDVRNNSAWNQRYFVISHTTGFTDDMIVKEVEYTKKAITKVVNNESPWSYLRGVLAHCECGTTVRDEVLSWCQNLFSEGHTSPHLLAFIIDLLQERMERLPERKAQDMEMALKLCQDLANEHDKIRSEYWNYMARKLSQKFGA